MASRLRSERTLTLSVKVVPRAAKAEVDELSSDGILRVRLTAVPERGKANQELCELLAAYFDVPKRNVEIVSGHTSQHKRVRILAV